MAQIPNLDNSPINLSSLREQSQRELLNLLKNVRGKKCMVIDPKLGGSLSLLIQTSLLKENGVELRHLSAEPIQTESTKVLYLVRSRLKLMKFISSHIQNDISKGLQKEYFVYFVPRRTVVCEKIFEEEKVHNLLTLGEYPLYTMPLDEDVLSFDLDYSFRECQVDGDMSSLWHVAKAIHKLELSFGVIPNLRAKGKASTKVAEILNCMQEEEPFNSSEMGAAEINTLILIDRELQYRFCKLVMVLWRWTHLLWVPNKMEKRSRFHLIQGFLFLILKCSLLKVSLRARIWCTSHF